MHLHANYVSTSVFSDGDYYQATFEAGGAASDALKVPQQQCAAGKSRTPGPRLFQVSLRTSRMGYVRSASRPAL